MNTMEAYFPVSAKRTVKEKGAPSSDSNSKATLVSVGQHDNQRNSFSSSTITKALLKTLSDPLNPITHSDIYERTDHIVSFATGHQVSSGRKHQASHARTMDRDTDLPRQQEKTTKLVAKHTGGVLSGTIIYIDGYLESTTDIEMKRQVLEAGGQIVHSPSQCTHILTSRGLSGSKTHKILTKRTKNIYVVKPEWVFDSIAIGKRRPERTYAIVKQANTLQSFLEASK